MPNPAPGCWYWHRSHDCPVYIRRIDPRGLIHYDLMISNGGEWPSVARGAGLAAEFDPWPLRGLESASLMESDRKEQDI